MKTKLIVGLGNIGKQYENTRHNIGFNAIDLLGNFLNISFELNNNLNGFYGILISNEFRLILFKPTTYMNLSGIAVKKIIDFYKINVEDIIIIFDDMNLPLGKVRLRIFGSSGGHNGIKNIIDNLSTDKIKRIRIGIGRPETNINVKDFVLSKFSDVEFKIINKALEKVKNAVLSYLDNDFNYAMNKFNID